MSDNTDSNTDPPGSDEESVLSEITEGPAKPQPVGFKFILASILLLAFVGYLIFVALSDPRGDRREESFLKIRGHCSDGWFFSVGTTIPIETAVKPPHRSFAGDRNAENPLRLSFISESTTIHSSEFDLAVTFAKHRRLNSSMAHRIGRSLNILYSFSALGFVNLEYRDTP